MRPRRSHRPVGFSPWLPRTHRLETLEPRILLAVLTQDQIDSRPPDQPLVFNETVVVDSPLNFDGELNIQVNGGGFEVRRPLVGLLSLPAVDHLRVEVKNYTLPDPNIDKSILIASSALVVANGDVTLRAVADSSSTGTVAVAVNGVITADNLRIESMVNVTPGSTTTGLIADASVGTGASLFADTVQIQSIVDSQVPITLDATADVLVATGALIRGDQGVDLRAGDLITGTTTGIQSRVVTAANAEIIAGPRDDGSGLQPRGALDFLALIAQADTIEWDADVTALSGSPNAELVIDPAGEVIVQENISADISPGLINVTGVDIPGADLGQILFTGDGMVSGAEGTFRFQQAYESVLIDVASDADLQISDIQTYNDGSVSRPGEGVRIDAPKVALEFDVGTEFSPTFVGVFTGQDVMLNGLIDNPIGTTRIFSGGSINASGPNQVVRTNLFDVDAPLDIGGTETAEERVFVQLVLTEDDEPQQMIATAGQNILMDIQGLLRGETAGPENFTIDMELIDAEGFVDLQLLEGLDQTTSNTSPVFLIDVFETERVTDPAEAPNAIPSMPPRTTTVRDHFRSDLGSQQLPLGIFGTGSTHIETTYDFGLIEAGGGQTAATAGDIDLDALFGQVNISGGTNLIPDMDGAFGNVDVSTSGKIQL
ncbi:MAG: hypothetical protein ACR2NU_01585, partial [Aeoliella sp.]